ncbi:FG-GAP repeat protein [Myxococcota bacterium]
MFDCSSIPCTEITKLAAHDAEGPEDVFSGELFGYRVALSGSQVLVGDPYENTGGGSKAGAAYLFDCSSLPCSRTRLTASDSAAGDKFGASVALSSDLALVCAPYADANGRDSGAAYLFQ